MAVNNKDGEVVRVFDTWKETDDMRIENRHLLFGGQIENLYRMHAFNRKGREAVFVNNISLCYDRNFIAVRRYSLFSDSLIREGMSDFNFASLSFKAQAVLEGVVVWQKQH